MPNQSVDAAEQVEGNFVIQEFERVLPNIVVSGVPILTSGINRKINIGNYENIDVFAAISLPLPETSLEEVEALKEIVAMAAELGFSMMAKEINARYAAIKELQSPRKTEDEAAT